MRSVSTLIFLFLAPAVIGAEVLKINGSTTVFPPVNDAAAMLRERLDIEIRVDTQGGSSGGISMLGEKLVHIGMSSKSLAEKDRMKYQDVKFHETSIGEDAVALVVSKDVWEGGVRAISKEEMQGIYEGRIRNWKELGGPDRRIVFFNKEPGRGTWEVFAKWLYGDSKKAPLVSFPEVGANEEARNKVGSTRGAISQLSYSWADRERVFPLAIREGENVIEPGPETIVSGSYPMRRPLFLLTDGKPEGNVKAFLAFMLGNEGQELVRKHGYLALADLDAPAAAGE